MAFTLLSSVCSLATKLTATIPSSPSSSSTSPSLLSPTHAVKEDLEKLQRTLRRIQAVLADAERREILDDSVKLWVKELKGVAYDAEDVLEEYEHELRRMQVESRVASAEATRKRKREQEEQQVRELNSILSQLSIPERMRKIRERFDEISKDREALHLREGDGIRRPDVSMNWPQPTSSHVDESGIFGRKKDKDKVVEMLLSDESCRFSVIPIVGMGGLGKTTLAQLVYNDQRVKQYFDFTCWVCVSEIFDVSRLTKEMIESISKESCNLTQLNALQDILKEQVKGKKVLLVLDDVWNEQQGPWDSFRAPLGSVETIRIIATTRNDPVAEIMQTVSPYRPACLSDDQCWSLFEHRAFGGRDPKDYPHLEEIGRKIIEKCGRLPLSVKTIGGLLHYEFDEDRWTDILGSDLWNLDQAKREILPALMLSYHHLPAHLKPCFLFSSLFPKDYECAKKRLVELWIAQGFILPCGNKGLEDIGSQYFDELQMRSLFQLAYWDNEYFVLHDAIHDLARSISEDEYLSITVESDDVPHEIPKEVRHLFVNCNSFMVDHLTFYEPRALRTLIVEEEESFWLTHKQSSIVNLNSLGCLRAVELIGPDRLTSVSNLKHLRHLNIRNESRDLHLPESPCHLYNLLFIDIGNFVSLQHLSLCGPAVFPGVVSVENNELGLMNQACYPPSSNLWKYVESVGILPCLCKLTIKRNSILTRLPILPSSLQSLKVVRCTNLTSLSCLQNLTSLRTLLLSNCPKLQFGQEESLPSKLQDVHISDCWKLMLVTGLKNLTALKSLVLKRCPLLQICPDEFLPCTPQQVVITDCLKLKEWCKRYQFQCNQEISKIEKLHIISTTRITDYYGVDNLSSLKSVYLNGLEESYLTSAEWLPPTVQTLEVRSSKSLKSVSISQNLSSLEKLIMYDCLKLTSVVGIQNVNSLKELVVRNCPEFHLSPNEYLPSSLQSLEVTGCESLTSLPLHQNLSSLEKLIMCGCLELTSVVGIQTLNSLKELVVRNCPEFHLSPNEYLPPSLQSLEVTGCESLTSLPLHQNLSSLEKLIINDCLKHTSLAGMQNLNSLPSKLQDVHISNCDKLILVTGLKNMSSLRKLHLSDCPKLQFGQEESLPSKLQDVLIRNCWKLMLVTGLKNLNSLKSFVLEGCPHLQISPDESLPCTPGHVKITDCLRLSEWCKRHQFQCKQRFSIMEEISKIEELDIYSTAKVTDYYGVDNLSSLKRLCLSRSQESYLPSDEWLPPTVQTLEVCLSENLKSLSLHQNVSSLRHLLIENCIELTSVVGMQNTSLKELVITYCPKLHLSPKEYLPSSLQSLEVNGCESLTSLPLHQNLSSLEKLIIIDCLKLTSVVGMQNLNSLKELVIKDCPVLQLSPNEYLPSSLHSLEVNGCESLRSLPLQQILSSLEKLNINDCLNLMSVVGIQNLNSLKELVIKDCPALQLSPNESLPCSLHSLNVSDCKSLRSLPLLHHKMSAFEILKLSNCSSLTDVCGLSDVPSLQDGIIWDCPEVLLSSEEWLRINRSLQLVLVTNCLRPQQSDMMAPVKRIDAAVRNKDQFLQLGLPMDHASNSLMELPLSIDINAEPQSDTMAPAKKIDTAVGNKDQFLQLGLPMDHASNSLMELPLSIDINAEPQQT